MLVPTVKKPITVYSNLLKQMNAKLKQDLYRLNFEKEFSDAMVVGVDVCHAGRHSIVGLAATYTPHLTQHFSRVYTHDLHKELIGEQRDERLLDDRISILSRFTEAALKNFEVHNKKLPGRIVVYRDGVGGPSMQEKVLKVELGKMTEALNNYRKGYLPKILYIFVNKETNARFFEQHGTSVLNPPEGTLVDTDLVELDEKANEFDFYMIPHHASIATARPVHYIVGKNDGSLPKRTIEQFTYAMCYNYFNFGGSIKGPCSVMYAHKIANYCFELKTTAIPESLANNLHFL